MSAISRDRLERGSNDRADDSTRPVIIYHRGNREVAVENSVAAFRAIDVGIGPCAVEFDVHLTADNVPVVIHDPNLHHVYRENLVVAEHTYAELYLARLADGTGLPTLGNVLSIVKPLALAFINIELKGDLALHPGVVGAVFDTIDSSGISRERFVISSFDHGILRAVHEAERMMRIGVLAASAGELDAAGVLAGEIAAWSINPSIALLGERTKKKFENRRMIPYTVNGAGDLKKALAYGAYGVFTDRPSKIAGLLSPKKSRRP